MDSLGGKLLIAGPDLWDPNFRRTVVLIGHHDAEGAVGVILNRPGEVSVGEAAPGLAELVGPQEVLFLGGPVQQESAVVVADLERLELAGVIAFGTIGFLAGGPDRSGPEGIRRARAFAGHAGWGPGQLEAEMAQGSWIVEPARAEDVFSPDPGRLWQDVLVRKGREYRVLALMPMDPALN